MNELELSAIREKMRAFNNEIMLQFLTGVLRNVLGVMPTEIKNDILAAIAAKLESQKKEYEMLPFKNLPPEVADLMSSENHEQFLSICRDIENKLGIQSVY